MKLTIVALFSITALIWAHEGDPQHKLMTEAGATMKSLKKNVDANSRDDASKDAQKMTAIFKQVEEIWTKSNTEDAMKWSKDAQAAASDLASGSGDMADGFKALGASCAGCHAAHREKAADGTYKTKP